MFKGYPCMGFVDTSWSEKMIFLFGWLYFSLGTYVKFGGCKQCIPLYTDRIYTSFLVLIPGFQPIINSMTLTTIVVKLQSFVSGGHSWIHSSKFRTSLNQQKKTVSKDGRISMQQVYNMTWRIIPGLVSGDRIHPPLISAMEFGHLEGVVQQPDP